MKRNFLMLCLIVFVMLSVPVGASADTITGYANGEYLYGVLYNGTTYNVNYYYTAELPDHSGSYLGTLVGENNVGQPGLVQAMLDSYLTWSEETGIPTDLSMYSAVTVNAPNSSSSGVYITYSAGNLSGTWQTWEASRPDDPALLSFYIVKAGDDFSLFWVDPAQDNGTWSVEHLPLNSNGQSLQVSHVTAYVPEPSSAILLGTGLLGLFCFNRKRFIK